MNTAWSHFVRTLAYGYLALCLLAVPAPAPAKDNDKSTEPTSRSSHPGDVTQSPVVVEARKLLDAGSYDECESKLAQYLPEHSNDVDARMLHADVLNRLGRYHYAADEMKIALAGRPNDSSAHLLMGSIWQSMHRPALAVLEYKKYLDAAPASDGRKQQYQTLIGLLTEEAQSDAERKKSKRAQPGDYFKALAGQGMTMRWKNPGAIKVFVVDGKSVPGYRSEFEEALRQAFDEWTDATDGLIGFVFVNKPEDGQMKVIWSDDMHAPALKAEAGHAQSRYGADGIESSEISLLTLDPFKDGPIGRNYLYNICLHEIGHALGLQVHSPYEEDIMYPQLYTQQGLSHRDINTIVTLYLGSTEKAEELPFEDEWGRPLSPAARADRLAREGNYAAMAGQYKKAIPKLEAALAIDPKDKVTRSNLVVSAYNLAIAEGTDRQAAIDLLHKALKWDPASDFCKSALDNIMRQPAK